MLNEVFHTEQLNTDEDSDEYNSSKSTGIGEGENFANQNGVLEGGECGLTEFDLISSCMDSFEVRDSIPQPGPFTSEFHIDQQLQQFTDFGSFDDLYLDVVSPPFQSFDDDFWKLINVKSQDSELIEPEKKRQYAIPPRSLEILKKYGNKQRRLNGKRINVSSYEMQRSSFSFSALSAEIIIKLAAEKFIRSNSRNSSEISMLSHPCTGSILGPSTVDSKEIQLVQILLSSAEKVGEKQYERAIKLLRECDRMSSSEGTPVQRLVFYFSEALYEKIDRETGRITPKGLGKKSEDPLKALKCKDSILIAFCYELPLARVTSFAAIQALVEHLAEARKVHIIDLEIRNGIHCITLMQALSTRCKNPIEHLTITAVGIKSKEKLEETGRRLTSFAQSLNFHFSFNIVVEEDILDLNIDLFKFDTDEAVAVYAAYALTTMIGCPDRLKHIMEVIRTINPCVMIVTEIEANCNSPIFVDRFVESLFYYGAFFDTLADCMKNDEKNRRDAESTCCSSAIRNIVGTQGKERKVRHVSVNVWRAFFERFQLVEIELSMSSMYQANLVLKNFTSGNSTTFDMNGKCLTIGWKGTPLTSISARKFQ
ncbi:DELLA protein RGL1-like [Olea europaea var. sylvestris]|uniref:DELLA protein RGL1-like n=1 Tax=Olea europaea var. sylvestris TaxID=158386 RepID=UPI000C1D17EC|nr:DELLA protein RGL1-like [Olea europaea var. sylvestris]